MVGALVEAAVGASAGGRAWGVSPLRLRRSGRVAYHMPARQVSFLEPALVRPAVQMIPSKAIDFD